MKDRLFAPKELTAAGFQVNSSSQKHSLFHLLSYPNVTWDDVVRLWPALGTVPADVAEQLQIEGLYQGYLSRQQADIDAFVKDESLKIPDDIDYAKVGGLSIEIQMRLNKARPETLGVAARLPAMTPAAITALLGYLKSKKS